jgi:hypothetical protein
MLKEDEDTDIMIMYYKISRRIYMLINLGIEKVGTIFTSPLFLERRARSNPLFSGAERIMYAIASAF